MSQQKYAMDLLKELGKLACKLASTPIEPNHKLGWAQEDIDVDREIYQHLVGKLIYLSHTKANIAYVIGVISQSCTDQRKFIYKLLI